MENINDTYFDGYYKDLWRSLIPEELTRREIDFMLPYFDLHPGSKVLDLMCGYGRHAIGLARKGVAVTAVDNLHDYILEIQEVAEKEELPLKAIQSEVLSFNSEDQFDLVLCMGNSLNFFNEQDCQTLLNNIAAQLKEGAHLLINSWSIAEIAIKNFQNKMWSQIGDKKFIVESEFLFQPTRIESTHLILSSTGLTEQKRGVDYIFTISELEKMFAIAKLAPIEYYAIPGKKRFTIGEPRIYIIAQKYEN